MPNDIVPVGATGNSPVIKETRICLFGAAPDTTNLGVSALCQSTVAGLCDRIDQLAITIFDYQRGNSPLHLYGSGRNSVQRCGGFHTKRLYRSESLWNIRLSARLGGLWNAGARILRSSDVILDISGGDSFTDMYGPQRFRSVTLPKLIAIEQRKPLILLPQTYGPFRSPNARRVAQRIVQESTMAWARDQHSFVVLQELLGNNFSPSRHRVGVDVAFALPVAEPAAERLATVADGFIGTRRPTVGLNVSGLVMNRPKIAAEQYGLKADYSQVIISLARRLLRESDAQILLVPHVVAPPGSYESDIEACESVAKALADEAHGRVAVLPGFPDPSEVKWVISHCDWFCGTRMHSTIAALSSRVPAAAIAYSSKTLGVFETCQQGSHVVDLRQLSTPEIDERLWQSWLQREQARKSLDAAMPSVIQRANEQMDEIVAESISASGSKPEAATNP